MAVLSRGAYDEVGEFELEGQRREEVRNTEYTGSNSFRQTVGIIVCYHRALGTISPALSPCRQHVKAQTPPEGQRLRAPLQVLHTGKETSEEPLDHELLLSVT